MQEDDVTKLGSLRAKLFSTSFNEKVVCIIFSLVAVVVLLLSIWYSYSQLGNTENVAHIFAIAAQCAGALVLVLEVFGESEEKQLRRTLGTPVLLREVSEDSVPTELVRIKASEIASKKASAVILILGYAAAFAANSPNPSMEALLSFVSATVGIILVVQSYAIWTMIKFQGETINLNQFYKDE